MAPSGVVAVVRRQVADKRAQYVKIVVVAAFAFHIVEGLGEDVFAVDNIKCDLCL